MPLTKRRMTMTKQAIRAALAGVLLLGAWAQPVWAGTWKHTFFPSNFITLGRSPGNALGDTPVKTDGSGNNYVGFAGAVSQFATSAEVMIPSFVNVTTMDCSIFGRISSANTGKTVLMGASVLITKANGAVKWSDNLGVGVYSWTTGGSGVPIVPSTTANGTISGVIPAIAFVDQATSVTCVSMGVCGDMPARLRLVRDVATPGANNDSSTFELIQLVCSATTN